MALETNWFDRQALISKLLTYAAILVLIASFGFGGFEIYESQKMPGIYLAIAGLIASAFIAGLSAIIDLLIINAEALRELRHDRV